MPWNHTTRRGTMKSLHNNESVRPWGPTGMDGENGESRSGVVGNERLTALAGAVLLVLILVELVSVVNLHALLVGVVAALLLFPGTTPWVVWMRAGQNIPAPLVVGLVLAIVVLLVARPLRWR